MLLYGNQRSIINNNLNANIYFRDYLAISHLYNQVNKELSPLLQWINTLHAITYPITRSSRPVLLDINALQLRGEAWQRLMPLPAPEVRCPRRPQFAGTRRVPRRIRQRASAAIRLLLHQSAPAQCCPDKSYAHPARHHHLREVFSRKHLFCSSLTSN